MAKKITEYPAATSVSSGDTLLIVQGGSTKKATVSQLPAGSGGGATPGGSVGDLMVHGAGGALVPVTRADGSPKQPGDTLGVDDAGFWRAIPPAAATIYGVQFDATGERYASSAVSTSQIKTARVRLRIDQMPSASLTDIAGPNNIGALNGWFLCVQDVTTHGTVGQLVLYAGDGTTLHRVAQKFLQPADVGKVYTFHLVADGTKVWPYLNGRRIGPGVNASTIANPSQFTIVNGLASDGSLANNAFTLIDMCEADVALTPTQVAADVAAGPGSTFAGQTHLWTASPSVGATWADQVGGLTLNKGPGDPTVVSFVPSYANHVGALEIWGDSIAYGAQATGATDKIGDGWVRKFQQTMSATYGKVVTLIGQNFPQDGHFDYDIWRSCLSSEQIANRVTTLAADLPQRGPPDAATLLAYGINDIVLGNRTAVQLKNDITTAVSIINTARPGRPIFICDMLPRSPLAGSQLTEWTAYQNGFASMITTLKATYPNVVGISYSAVVTNPADTAQLYDGTHPAPPIYSAMADVITPIVAAAMT